MTREGRLGAFQILQHSELGIFHDDRRDSVHFLLDVRRRLDYSLQTHPTERSDLRLPSKIFFMYIVSMLYTCVDLFFIHFLVMKSSSGNAAKISACFF